MTGRTGTMQGAAAGDRGTAAAGPARLGWQGAELLPPEARAALLGPGAPFELVVEPVRGQPLPVFARRPRHLRALLDEAAAIHGDLPYLVDGGRRWSFREACATVDALAAVLAGRHGIGRGDRVAIVSANSPEYALVMWAVLTLGGVVTSLNGWWTGPELRYGVELARPALIAGDERRLARLAEDGPPAAPVVTLTQLLDEARAGAVDPPAAPARPPAPAPAPALAAAGDVAIDEDDPAVILFTSGTTGRPKGATLSHRNIVNFACVIRLAGALAQALVPAGGSAPAGPSAPRLPGTPQPATILASPLFHVSGMVGLLVSGPALGTKLVFPPPGRWDPSRHLAMTAEHRISQWSGVPTQFWRLLRHPDFPATDLRSLQRVGSGGAPFPPDLVRALTEALPGVTLSNGYGMSETVGLGTLVGGPLMVARPESVGPAQPGAEVEIRDPSGRVLPEGETGEIHLRTASVFLGYWENPEATAAALDGEGWYRTGDFGRIVDGMLVLDSRRRDLVIRGGENIYPIEIENRLVEHPDIHDAAVIGVDHPELGQEVKAFVVPRPGSRLEPAEVQRWVGEALAAFKVPAHVELRESLPYTETGKVLKHELEREERERVSAGGASEIESGSTHPGGVR